MHGLCYWTTTTDSSRSKGVDIDANQYLDVAIGAPNAETVYIYKSYPVIRINATISPESQEIRTTDQSFKLCVCWLIESVFPINFDVLFHAVIKLDGQLGCVTFSDKTNQYEINGNATANEQCVELPAFVTYSMADIFKPIVLEMSFDVINGVPGNSNEFCTNCVATNPNDPKVVKNKVVFSTGCASEKYVADLRLKSSLVGVKNLPYILGSSSSLTIEYRVENVGQTAYLAQIRVTLPEINVRFIKTPSSCELAEDAPNKNVMLCDLNNGSPLFQNDTTSFQISIDTTKLDGTELIVKSQVFSTGDELNDTDNAIDDIIPLGEFSDIEITGDSSSDTLTLQTAMQLQNITHTFEIRNNGPSNVKSLDVLVSVPISHTNPWTLERERIIEFSSISIKGKYNNQPLAVEWTQNNTIMILDAVESSSMPSIVALDNFNGMQFDSSKIGLEYELNSGGALDNQDESFGSRRRRRSLVYNKYSERVIDLEDAESTYLSDQHRYRRDIFNTNNHLLSNLPVNRTIYFDCQNSEDKTCLEAKFTVLNFKASSLPILISLNFTINMKKIENVMTEKRDIFEIRTVAEVKRTAEENDSTLRIIQTQPYTIISKYVDSSTPLWVYVVSIIFCVLSLILITYCLHRFGFFKRGKREELVKLKRQSEAMAYYPNEDEE